MVRKLDRSGSASAAVLLAAPMLLATAGGALAAPKAPPRGPKAPPGGPRYVAGSDSAGEPYFPYAGNGGYDVLHYDLDITYTPPEETDPPTPLSELRGQLEGVATIDLVATQDLDAFNLDLRGMEVERITLDGKLLREVAPPQDGRNVGGPAWWHVQDDEARRWELTIQPRPKLKAGESVEVVITYGGETTRPTDVEGALYGWVTTPDGAMVVSEPEGP